MPGFQLSGPVLFALPGFLLRKIAGWRLRLIRPGVTKPLKPRRQDKRLRAIRHSVIKPLKLRRPDKRLHAIRHSVIKPLKPRRPDKRLRAIRHYHRGSIAGWRLRLIRPTTKKSS